MPKKTLVPITVALLMAILAGLWMSIPASAQGIGPGGRPIRRLLAARRSVGQVTAMSANQFTIEKLNGEEQTYQVDANTRFIDRDKQEHSFSDLKVDRWVIVVAPVREREQPVARLVAILPEDFDPSEFSGARGLVTSVDVAGQEFSIKSRQGEDKTFSTNSDTRFRGSVKSLADLQTGMQVGVVVRQQDSGALLATSVLARPQIERFGGEITAVDPSANTFTLHTRRGDQDITVKVDENTRFRSKGGAVQSLEDIQPGMMALVLAGESQNEAVPVARLVVVLPLFR